MKGEQVLPGIKKRVLQLVALYAPGSMTLRIRLHRWRGVDIGEGVFIGTDTIIETSYPERVSIGNNVEIGMRVSFIAHNYEGAADPLPKERPRFSIRVEDDVQIGPGSIILPNVTIGYGAVVMAGSVVTRSVPPLTMVQGNPARPVARCGIPLTRRTSLKEFYRRLEPIR